MEEKYKYTPVEAITFILEGHGGKNSILAESESPQEMIDRVVTTLIDIEKKFGTTDQEMAVLRTKFIKHFTQRDFVPGMPTLTNAGSPGHEESALSSCVVIPVDLLADDARDTITSYYRQNMGSGFNFSRYDDPVAALLWVNKLSHEETATGLYDRRIANMGTLHVSHPKIEEFVETKISRKDIVYFNISVEVTDEFMEAALQRKKFTLADGSFIDAYALLTKIANAAWKCGDPGLINLDRMNQHNPLAEVSPYESAPPCGEMGLAPGETCQFGYVNLANFVEKGGDLRLDELKELVIFLVRILDNAIEYGMQNQPTALGQNITRLKRKIGISVVGLADALIKAGLAYDSQEGRDLVEDLVSFINYHAKVASVALAKDRGSCEAMSLKSNMYYQNYLSGRFANKPTNTVSKSDWLSLEQLIADKGLLRNIHHTALPPGARASMVLGVNHSIEPIFSPTSLSVYTIELILEEIAAAVLDDTTDIQTVFNNAIELGSFQNLPISDELKDRLKTAVEINPEDHLKMVASLAGMNGVSDESASKTVNLPKEATPNDILEIYLLAHELGLKNISVYRDGSLDSQPRTL